jgi:hypothetical protein
MARSSASAQRLDPHRTAEHGVEQFWHPGVAAAHVRRSGITAADCRGRAGGSGAEGEDRTMHVAGLQRLQRPPTGVGGGHDDGLQRLAQRSLHRRLPAVVDLDDVEQRAEHTVDAGEVLGTGTGTGALQCEVQRFARAFQRDASSAASWRPASAASCRGIGGDAASLGGFHVGDQRSAVRRSPATIAVFHDHPLALLGDARRLGDSGVALSGSTRA